MARYIIISSGTSLTQTNTVSLYDEEKKLKVIFFIFWVEDKKKKLYIIVISQLDFILILLNTYNWWHGAIMARPVLFPHDSSVRDCSWTSFYTHHTDDDS